MAEITGVVNSIIYRNSDNGWTVLELCPDEGEKLTVVGALPLANVGERLELTGEYSSHPKYGSQFKATAYHTIAPATLSAIETYLGSGIIKPAQEIVTELGKERKLTAIFERSQSGMLYVEEDRNLTDEVIKRLNAKNPAPKPKDAKESKEAKPTKAK